MNLRDTKRRAYDMLASSILRGIEVSNWWYDGKEVRLPLYLEVKPDGLYLFKTWVEIPHTEYTWYLKFVLSGNALLKLNGKLYAGIDEAHTYVKILPGAHEVELKVSPRTLFGFHNWKLAFEKSYLIEVIPEVFDTGLYVLWIAKFAEHLPRDSELRRDLENLLFRVTTWSRLNPSLRQITLLHILLYVSGSGIRRGDLPEEYGDYAWLAGVYGVGVLKGYLNDIEESKPEEIIEEARRIRGELEEGLKVLREKYPKLGTLYIAGHSHIDAAWLWPRSETIEKVLRTFSTATVLMNEYNIAYVQSSAQYYQWIEEIDKALFNGIKRLVKEGKWIPTGGMWIESDTNIIEGECLARQFLYGQRYFLEKFGRISRIGWLPDSFGFSGNLPQVLKKSGIEVFVTHKVMWNDTNEFPYHSFNWVGIDGTSIPVQILITSYNEPMTPNSVNIYWSKYKQREHVPFTIYVYGYGDGGGGPTEEMVKYIELINKLPHVPYVKNINEDNYISEVKKYESLLPSWRGELYLEFHRGTYTTNIAVKNAVAEAERMVITAEAVLTALEAVLGQCVVDKERRLSTLWKKLLFNEFHDILPGSSIREVCEDALEDLKQVVKESCEMLREAISKVRAPERVKTLVVASAIPWNYRVIVKIPKEAGIPENSECQEEGDGYYVSVEAGPLGVRAYKTVNTSCTAEGGVKAYEVEGNVVIENEYLRVTINESGDIGSLLLKNGVELLREPAKLLVHDDKPGIFDAWELTSDFLNQGIEMKPLGKPRLVVKGPLVSCVELAKGFENSVITQRLCVYKGIPVIEIQSKLKWLSKGVLVKHWFKTTVNASKAVFDIPFGAIERSMKFETSWERAMFEVPALRWIDVSDGEKGFAIIASSRHGYSVIGGNVGLSVIRSPIFPNPWSDVGEFTVVYYLYPHGGDYRVAELPRVARELLFKPFIEVVEGTLDGFEALSVKPPLVVLSAFKKSQDGKEYIVRLYNPYGSHVVVTLALGFNVKKIAETNIVETETLGVIAENTRLIELQLKPFEIKTLRLEAGTENWGKDNST